MSDPTPERPATRPAPPSRAAYALLGAMTLVSFAGPFAIALALRGGDSPRWPPDRPAERAVVGGVFAVFAACLLGCLTVRLWLPRPRTDEGPKSDPS